MTQSTVTLLALGTLLPLTTSAPAPLPAQEREVKDADLGDLAEKLAEWIDASIQKKKELEAQAAVKEAVEKLGKKLKKDPLALPADFGHALYLSYDYKKQRVAKGKIETMEAEAFGQPFEFAVSAPSSYDAKKQSYPLLLCIPDEKEDPKTHLIEDWTTQEVREGCILASPPMPGDVSLWTQSGSPEGPGGAAYVLTTFGKVRDMYAIDFDRVFLVGKGRGVEAAIAIGEMFPERFAGIAGRAGGPAPVEVTNFGNLPTLFCGGDARASEFQKKIDELGSKNCTLLPDGQEADVWNWIAPLTRNANPAEVSLVPGNPFPKRAYWIEVPPVADPERTSRVTARVERETNTILVEARGVTDVTIYFNDELVNLDDPVKVVVNGVESLDQIPRNLLRTLDMIYSAKSDPGRIYVETKTYAVRPPAEDGK